MSDRIKELEARLAEVEKERNLLQTARQLNMDALARCEVRAEAAEAANLPFYRAGIEAAKNECQGIANTIRLQQVDYTHMVAFSCRDAIRDLPDPTDEQMDAIRKGV